MSFGRNPHVAKAQAAEEKAQRATDAAARSLAWRESANFWDRAAERERDPKRKDEYEKRAEHNRSLAEADDEPTEVAWSSGAASESKSLN
jgi:hypothetical protein